MKPLLPPNAFQNLPPPWNLGQLDANFTSIQAAINDTLTYTNYFVDQSSIANSVIVSIPAALSVALSAGTRLDVKINNTNTATTTITVNTLPAQTIVNPDGSLMSPSQLSAGSIATFEYDGTNFQFLGSWVSPALRRTAAEISAGVVPANYAYPPGDVRRYNPIGDGVTDDTVPISNFIKVANTSPGLRCYLEDKTYAISAALPNITASGVIIQGTIPEIHDVGAIFSGTVLKWIGSAGGTMLTIAPIQGPSAQRLAGIIFEGCAFDGNSLASNGLVLTSVRDSRFDIGVANVTGNGLTLNVAATLGESADTQRNTIRFVGRQIEAPNGVAIRLQGNTIANTSMNSFWCDIQHRNASAIIMENSDNNDFWFLRTNSGAGTAVENVSCFGGTSAGVTCRDERFHYITSNLTLHAYGTGAYAVAAGPIRIYNLDIGNATPIPTVDAGATVFWNKDTTPFGDTPWVSYTPAITASSGAFTTVSASGSYLQRGRIVNVRIVITITTNGTAAGAVLASLPVAAVQSGIGSGKETAITGNMLSALCSASTMTIQTSTGTYPGQNGAFILATAQYEVA